MPLLKNTMDLNSIRWDLAQMIAETANTPDLVKLEKQTHHLLFAPDSLKRGEVEHEKLKDAEYKGFAYTHRKFVGYKFSKYDEPFFLSNTDYLVFKAELAPVSGELFKIPTNTLISLDNLRSNGLKFQRVYVKLSLPYRRKFPKAARDIDRAKYGSNVFEDSDRGLVSKMMYASVWAWMYVGKNEYWHDKMDKFLNFAPVPRMRPNSNWTDSYYFFSHNENVKTNIE